MMYVWYWRCCELGSPWKTRSRKLFSSHHCKKEFLYGILKYPLQIKVCIWFVLYLLACWIITAHFDEEIRLLTLFSKSHPHPCTCKRNQSLLTTLANNAALSEYSILKPWNLAKHLEVYQTQTMNVNACSSAKAVLISCAQCVLLDRCNDLALMNGKPETSYIHTQWHFRIVMFF